MTSFRHRDEGSDVTTPLVVAQGAYGSLDAETERAEIFLELRKVSVAFDDARTGGRVSLLEDVSCVFAPGTLTAVLGPSGAGKTTLFRAASQQLPEAWAAGGSVLANGRPLAPGEFMDWGAVSPQDDVLLGGL
eukprot:CAMPEP_0119264790 /NCGR_PEP_ID=MMETSP1329-20130426/3793_1 /TAXON_ID=114041 /ORGANISM="Genus nov. species nov., Strain RCC1024" /LENGTH=132 /DNA_ID=CAMNT_0007264583 /DNA_START=213 /DNA_END=607 /DNA_ORIENTATION=-